MIITLCGSNRFEDWFHAWNEALSLSGHVVFSLAVNPSWKNGKVKWYTADQKKVLDQVHLKKIAASRAILVLNPFAYIGESTLKEIEFAKKRKKILIALESWGKGNGIGPEHFPSVRKKAESFGVDNFGSPIDTTTRSGFNGPWGDVDGDYLLEVPRGKVLKILKGFGASE